MRSQLLSLLALCSTSTAISLDLNSPDSVRAASKQIAADLVSYYSGNKPGNTPGMLPGPYYWWEAGAMFGTLIDYWYYTGDSQYNDITTQALLFQVGDDRNYEPANVSVQLGNDDQAFWAMSTLTAAEYNFPNPPKDQPQWLELSQAVFNRQRARWAKNNCHVQGGLRWQIFPYNNGYDYINSISNGCYFNIAARLAKYTGNTTYINAATETWDWTVAIGLISSDYRIWDGTDSKNNCTDYNNLQWSYNVGVFLYGAATMWNVTGSEVWRQRTQSLLDATGYFFTTDQIMTEAACEPMLNCNTDQPSFKAFLSRWMAASTKVAPWTYDFVMERLRPSAVGAAKSCSGGASGTICGQRWYTGTWDGTNGVGQQLSALEVVMGAGLIDQLSAPVTNTTGGTSQGNYLAGTGLSDNPFADLGHYHITGVDRGGAGALTALVLITLVGGGIWAMF